MTPFDLPDGSMTAERSAELSQRLRRLRTRRINERHVGNNISLSLLVAEAEEARR